MDRLSNCSVSLVRSTQTAASTSLAKTQRSCCFCWTLMIDYRIAFIYSVNYWLQFILACTGVVYLIVFRIFNAPRERLRSIVTNMSVCMSVCPRGYLWNHTRDLYQFFVHVTSVHGPVLLRHADDRLHRLSAGRGWQECITRAKCNLRLPCHNFIFVLHHSHIRIIIHY